MEARLPTKNRAKSRHQPLTTGLTMKTILLSTALTGLLSGAVLAEDIIVAGFGGNVQEDLAKTLWTPAAEALGATLLQQSHDGLGAIRVQVQSGNPGWDVVHLGAEDCAAGAREGLFEPLDYNVIDAAGVPAGQKADNWVGINSYSVVLAWRKDKYGDKHPTNWADFWNTTDFPGRRALSVYPQEMFEIASMADGVAKDAMYPLDYARALASLEKIKPEISVWWTTGAQSAQLLADGEVDMEAIWSSRVVGVIKNGAPVEFTYQDAVLGTGCLAILKGTKKLELAEKFVGQSVSPALQARIPELMPYYSPTNVDAYALAKVSPEVLAESNATPENAAKQVALDFDWWAENMADMVEEYRVLIGQ